MASTKTRKLGTLSERYAAGIPRRDAQLSRTRLTPLEDTLIPWLHWQGYRPSAIARLIGVGRSTVSERVHAIYACPSVLLKAHLHEVVEHRRDKGSRRTWSFFCLLCGLDVEGDQHAGLQHVVNHFLRGVRASELSLRYVLEYSYGQREMRAEREHWRDLERGSARRGRLRRLFGRGG